MTAAPNRRWRSYGMLIVVAAFLLSPASLAPVWMLAGGALVGAVVAARVAGRSRARRAAAGRAVDGTALGSDSQGREVTLDDRQLSAHGLILGASGAGKSTTLLTILCDHIKRGRPIVAIDMKGSPSFARELGECRGGERAARSVSGHPTGPSVWNPLAPRQRDRAEGQADRDRAVHRAALPARGRAIPADGARSAPRAHPGRAATLDEVVSAMNPRAAGRVASRAAARSRKREYRIISARSRPIS